MTVLLALSCAYVTDAELEQRMDLDQDGYPNAQFGGADCNDGDPLVHPDAEDPPYDGLDADCAGGSDFDVDGDGHDSDAYGGADCDDLDPDRSPDAVEVPYDGFDANCDGASDDDADVDGHDSDAYGGDDCDDTDPLAYAGAAEIPYDDLDQACNGAADEWDVDGDGFEADVNGHGGPDCDDGDPFVFPGPPVDREVWYDGLDNDCDPGTDDCDQDGDQYLSEDHGCGGLDCDDEDASIRPGVNDTLLNQVDENCNGSLLN